jgi:hypothetical protein
MELWPQLPVSLLLPVTYVCLPLDDQRCVYGVCVVCACAGEGGEKRSRKGEEDTERKTEKGKEGRN